MVFLLKLSVCWGLFALLYALLLRQETFFRLNRIYLLGTAALGILLAGTSEQLLIFLTDDAGIATAMLPAFTVDLKPAEATIQQWKAIDYLWIVYAIGVAITLARMLWGIIRLVNMAARGQKQRLSDGCILIRTTETTLPFSFFKWVFVPFHAEAQHSIPPNPGPAESNFKLQTSNFELILSHECAHAHGWHSADVLLAELLCITFWFHPLAHWYRRALRTVHEYLADAEAARQVDKKQYGLLLIRQAQSGPALALVHHFFQSPLKQRLIMLMRQHSAPVRALKYGLLLPLATLFVLVFQQAPVLAQTPKESPKELNDVDVPPKFPGGETEMMKYLSSNIKYPESARKENAQGMVALSFVIEQDGSLSNVQNLTSSVHADLVKEAIRVVKAMPKWEPGLEDSKPVKVKFTLPIRFKL